VIENPKSQIPNPNEAAPLPPSGGNGGESVGILDWGLGIFPGRSA